MKVRSRGLGRKELVMDFRRYAVRRDGDDIVIEGTITEPVTWDFAIRMSPGDIPGMLKVGLNRRTIGLGVRWALRLGRDGHGSRDRGPGGEGCPDVEGRVVVTPRTAVPVAAPRPASPPPPPSSLPRPQVVPRGGAAAVRAARSIRPPAIPAAPARPGPPMPGPPTRTAAGRALGGQQPARGRSRPSRPTRPGDR